MHITHIITGLSQGGAESLLAALIPRLDACGIRSSVVSLTQVGSVGRQIACLGVPVIGLGWRRASGTPAALAALRKALGRLQPDVIHTWLYHADLAGGAVGRWLLGRPVVWSVHVTDLDPAGSPVSTHWVRAACGIASAWLPDRIICCSHSAYTAHLRLGYPAARMSVVPNGIDTRRFVPDASARASLRSELGLARDAPLLGMLARFHPQKDHKTFLRAVAKTLANYPQTHVVLCGRGVDASNPVLTRWIRMQGLGKQLHLLGEREDTARIQAGLDVACLASSAEALPLAVVEAMSCAVPVAATRVGDVSRVVGSTGYVVPPRRAEALAWALEQLLALGDAGRRALGERARRRAVRYFSIDAVAQRYAAIYRRHALIHSRRDPKTAARSARD